ncbi:MAG: diguanylate cyclase [Lachnospiraceae bacterium]|nr:diguanylate cyclase [Lachnospiraceae bacterium]
MKKIMIVDDERVSLMMTNHILSSEYLTVCASSGEEAIELFEMEQPDLVLSDLRMPTCDGYELLERITQIHGEGVPFVFMTADSDDETEAKGFKTGAMDFIRKPFRADVLLKRVGNILSTADRIAGLKKAADTDPMTGLLNKGASRTTIDNMVRHSQGVFLMIDLDSFKPVNDIYGHDMGDKVLIRFAEIVSSAVRSTDPVGRLGGDEFVAFCQNISEESVIADKAAYINDTIVASAKELMGEDMDIPIGASIGAVIAPDEGTDFDTLYRKADKVLYEVKQHGKHGYRLFKGMHSDGSGDSAVSDISNIAKIYGERSPQKGAMVLSGENFKIVYQFLVRMYNNYHKEVFILMFNLEEGKDADLPADMAAKQFINVMSESLRQSDVITQSSKNRFVVLLLETTRNNIEMVADRIRTNWARAAGSRGYELTYDLDIIN